MTGNLDKIETIIVVMMENRSFDHLLGYLSLPPSNRNDIEGFKPGQIYQNTYNGQTYPIHELGDLNVVEDPPHERADNVLQFGASKVSVPPFPMDGFVDAYAHKKETPKDLSLVMGYYTAKSVPMYDFLAREFAVCDHWFAPIPCGTQPNRLMAFGGESRLGDNNNFLLPSQDLVYDWLNERKIDWRSYSGGLLPFFALMPKWQLPILEDTVLPLGQKGHFRRYSHFQADWQAKKPIPPVIFIEPEYADILDDGPNDDHPPAHLSHGQSFIRDIYQTVTSNPARWEKTLLIITYDEPGGFYDHMSPILLETKAPPTDSYTPFSYSGARVPTLIVSPLIEAGTVHHENLDHTSILHLLAERFDPQSGYSAAVMARQKYLGSLSTILNRSTPRSDIPQPPSIATVPQRSIKNESLTANTQATCNAFQNAKKTMQETHPILWHIFKALR
jgi:phospholipase C